MQRGSATAAGISGYPGRQAELAGEVAPGAITKLGWDIMLELVKHMDSNSRSAWRLANKAACQAVYQGTTALAPSSAAVQDEIVALPLLDMCSGLKQLSCAGLERLASIQGLPPGLEGLDISRTQVRDLSPLERCTGLRKLSAAHLASPDYEGEWDAQQLASRILGPALQHLTGLQQLDLEGCHLSAEGAQALAPALHRLTRLQQLRLGKNSLGAEGAHALAPTLQQLTGLQQLHLEWNSLGAEGAHALAPALQQLTGLQQLYLGANRLGVEGAHALVPALQQLTGLQRLCMAGNNLAAEGAHALAPALQRLTGLQQLHLQGNGMGAEGAQALVPALQQLTALRTLELAGSEAEDAQFLAGVLKLPPRSEEEGAPNPE